MFSWVDVIRQTEFDPGDPVACCRETRRLSPRALQCPMCGRCLAGTKRRHDPRRCRVCGKPQETHDTDTE
jgi:hypothetical protein